MAGWRYFATKLNGDGTEALIADDLPLSDVEVELEISGPGGLRATVAPELARLKGPDGEPILKAWSTAIYAEKDGQLRGGGILADVLVNGPALELDCVGFSDYAKNMPYTADYSKIQVDPLDVVRHIWGHLQGATNGNIGLEVDDTKSDVLVGIPEDPRLTEAKAKLAFENVNLKYAQDQVTENELLLKQAEAATFAAVGMTAGGLLILSASTPSGDKRSTKNLWFKGTKDTGVSDVHKWNGKDWVRIADASREVAFDRFFKWQAAGDTLKASKQILADVKKDVSAAKSKVSDLREGEAVPYVLAWWETDDLGQAIDDLAADTPFDYRVTHSGNPDSGITHRLELGYPRLGRRLHELRFAVGENVSANPSIDFGEEDYADEVVVLGAGEGRAMVRGVWSKRTDRLRRVAVVEAKGTKKAAEATKLAEREVKLRSPEPEVEDSIEVLDHSNAPLGSFAPGDEIELITPDGWTDGLRAWYRVLTVTIHPDTNTASLSLVRAEKVA